MLKSVLSQNVRKESRNVTKEFAKYFNIFLFFANNTKNVYKSIVERFVQCKLSKLKMNIT